MKVLGIVDGTWTQPRVRPLPSTSQKDPKKPKQ